MRGQLTQRLQEVECLRSRKPVFKRIKEIMKRNKDLEDLVRAVCCDSVESYLPRHVVVWLAPVDSPLTVLVG